MKAKRKVHLSGKWWYPTREFEFFTEKSIGEVIDIVKDQHNLEHGNKLEIIELEIDENYKLSIYERVKGYRGLSFFINSKLQNLEDKVCLQGEISISNIFMFKVLFYTYILVPAFIFLMLFNQAKFFESLVCFLFPSVLMMLYVKNINERNECFTEFLRVIRQ